MKQTTRDKDETEHSNRNNGFGPSDSWVAGHSFADRAGEFRELDQHGSRFEVMNQCHAWEGQDHD